MAYWPSVVVADKLQASRSGLQMSSWPGTVIPRWRTSPSSRVGVSKASAFRFVSRTVCSSYSLLKLLRPSLSSRRCTDQDSGTVFRSISRLLRHFLSSALAWRHTSSNSVTREVMLSFMDTLIALTCLLYNLTLMQGNYSATSNNMKLVYIGLHWPFMGGLLHLIQRGGDWVGRSPLSILLAVPNVTAHPVNGQCTNHRIPIIRGPSLCD